MIIVIMESLNNLFILKETYVNTLVQKSGKNQTKI